MGYKGYQHYGLLISPQWPKAKLALFQVKKFNTLDDQMICISYACLFLWMVDHPTAQVVIHPDLDLILKGFSFP